MALSQRQLILYTDVVDIYLPSQPGANRLLNRDIEALQYPSTPTYAGVYCFRKTVSKIGKGEFTGREKQQSTTANIDTCHFEAGQVAPPNAVFQVKTTGDPELNQWYLISSEEDVNNFRANAKVVHVVKTTKPPGI